MSSTDKVKRQTKNVITFGTFDLLHVGHIRILSRAASFGDRLIVGISSDCLNCKKKGRKPVYSEKERMELVSSIKWVDEVFIEESLEQKREYIEKYDADILVMGDDWKDKFNDMADEVIYLPRTPMVSTTDIILKIKT